MRRNMKKIISLLTMLVCVMSLAGCAAREKLPKEEMYQTKSDQYVKMLTSMSEEELNEQIAGLEENFEDFEQEVALYPYISGAGQKFDFTADAYLSLFKSYASNLDEFGAYVGVKEYEGGVEKDGEVTYDVVYEFEKHDMRLSLVYNSHHGNGRPHLQHRRDPAESRHEHAPWHGRCVYSPDSYQPDHFLLQLYTGY